MTTHKRLTWKRIAVVAVGSLALGISGTAMALSTGEPADCVGRVPTVDDAGVTHLAVDCSFTAPAVTVTVPGPTVTVEVPGPTVYVTLPPSVSTTYITVTPSPTRPPVGTPTVGPTAPPTSTTPPPSGWPNAANTGVPAGVVLTAYTGPCTITAANTVIDSKTVNCTLSIRAANVVITNSRINGSVDSGSGSNPGRSFTIRDSEIITAAGSTGVGESFFTLDRVEVTGGNRQVHCYDSCTIRDSWVHGTRLGAPDQHASGVRMGQKTTLIHNSLACDVSDTSSGGGCSAPLTGYGDFEPIRDNLVQGNLFKATTGGTCAYGGASGGKPYSSTSGFNIDFVGNVFERGTGGKCGYYAPVLDWRRDASNAWTGNTWSTGETVPQP